MQQDLNASDYYEILQPIKWIADFTEEIETFGSSTDMEQKKYILEMISAFLSSENSEL